MKHGQEKSDPSTVAEKPANKPRQPGAESAEPREGTEGNTGKQHTYRTLAGLNVSQRLDCVREAARGIRRSPPEVGARCVNHARRDLCGGHPAMDVPTAIGTVANGAKAVRSGRNLRFQRSPGKLFSGAVPYPRPIAFTWECVPVPS
jgi:hypothetical protein